MPLEEFCCSHVHVSLWVLLAVPTLCSVRLRGTGFQCKGSYLFGHFSMRIKMVAGDSAGTVSSVTAFYLSSQNSEHDEIDFEFLGNKQESHTYYSPMCSHEERVTEKSAFTVGSYSVLWIIYRIVFFVDDVPTRVFKNSKDPGVTFSFNQPMKLYSSLWNADDWAAIGGLEKTGWSKAPFVSFIN